MNKYDVAVTIQGQEIFFPAIEAYTDLQAILIAQDKVREFIQTERWTVTQSYDN